MVVVNDNDDGDGGDNAGDDGGTALSGEMLVQNIFSQLVLCGGITGL